MRLTGPDAEHREALTRAASRFAPAHATLARASTRRVHDSGVVTWLPAPNSYTGEDVVEISGHGSPVLLRRIVELARSLGARGWPSPASSRCART